MFFSVKLPAHRGPLLSIRAPAFCFRFALAPGQIAVLAYCISDQSEPCFADSDYSLVVVGRTMQTGLFKRLEIKPGRFFDLQRDIKDLELSPFVGSLEL